MNRFDVNRIKRQNDYLIRVLSKNVEAELVVNDEDLEVKYLNKSNGYLDKNGAVLEILFYDCGQLVFTCHWHFVTCKTSEILDVIDNKWPMLLFEGYRVANIIKNMNSDDQINIVYSLDWPSNGIIINSLQFKCLESLKKDVISILFDISLDEVISFPIEPS